MRVGDVLEWVAGALGVTAAYVGSHQAWAAFATGAVVVFYQAQCYAKHGFPWPQLSRPAWLQRKRAE